MLLLVVGKVRLANVGSIFSSSKPVYGYSPPAGDDRSIRKWPEVMEIQHRTLQIIHLSLHIGHTLRFYNHKGLEETHETLVERLIFDI